MRVSKEQSYKIQLLRGIAIIAVVLIHNTPSGLMQVYVRPVLNFAVAMFIFISGLLSSIEKWSPWRRIWKVLVPYFIWTMIYTILHNYHFVKDIPLLFLKNLITGKSEAIMYYVFVYCQLTLLIPLINKLAKSKYQFLGLIVSPLEMIVFRLIPKLLNFQFSSFISLLIQLSCIGWLSYFYLGYLIGNNYINRNFKINRLIFRIEGGVHTSSS